MLLQRVQGDHKECSKGMHRAYHEALRVLPVHTSGAEGSYLRVRAKQILPDVHKEPRPNLPVWGLAQLHLLLLGGGPQGVSTRPRVAERELMRIPTLVKHKDSGDLYIYTGDCVIKNPTTSEGWVPGVTYESINGDDDSYWPRRYVREVEDFEQHFEIVTHGCGVDLYAILHEVLGKQTAIEYSDKIEIALCKAKENS